MAICIGLFHMQCYKQNNKNVPSTVYGNDSSFDRRSNRFHPSYDDLFQILWPTRENHFLFVISKNSRYELSHHA